MHPGPINPWTHVPRKEIAVSISQALYDHQVLAEMKAVLVKHLQAALLECGALSRELKLVDPDALMTELRKSFDPENPIIQDNFTDGFFEAVKTCNEFAEPL